MAALTVAGAGLVAAIWLPGIGDASASEQHPALADEFDGAPGTNLDAATWNIDGGAQNAVEDGTGRLVLTSPLRTRQVFTQPNGHAEASIRVSREAGVWRAFGVLDQFGRPVAGRLQTLQGGIDPTSGDTFHTYAIDWSPQAIVWSVDGHPTLRLLPSSPSDGIVLVLNFATDGTKSAQMTVDFVRVTVSGHSGRYPGSGQRPGTWPTGWPSGWPTGWPGPSTSASPTSPTPTSPSATSASPTADPPTTASPTPSETSASPSPSTSTSTSPSPSTSPTPKATEWKPFTDYAVGDLVTYEGVTYRVLEAHTSLPGWEPPALPNLFAKV